MKYRNALLGLSLLLIMAIGWAPLQALAESIYLPIITNNSESGTIPATTTSAIAIATAVATLTPTTTGDATPTIVAAANAFLATLSDNEKDAVLFDWTDTAQKQRWSNLPQGLYTRDGLMWGNLSETQKNAWLAVMQATLSIEGYNRVLAEWNADDQLAGGGGCCYGTQYYTLIAHYTNLANAEDGAARTAEIQSTLDQTYFAWYGPTTAGSAAYFRITGPTIVIEYAPQQMGGVAAHHIHGIYRDPTNDYGAKYTP